MSQIGDISISAVEYGNVSVLPAPQEETIFVTSALVAAAVKDREDVFSPGPLLRDDSGKPIGCLGLTKI